jgi:magnesium transporter
MLDMYISRLETEKPESPGRLEHLDAFEKGAWIRLTSPTEDEIRTVRQIVPIPDEFIRYALDEEERPRIDYDDDEHCVLILVDLPFFEGEGTETRYVTMPVGIILHDTGIVTVSLREVQSLEWFSRGMVKEFYTQYHTRFALQVLLSGAKSYLQLLRFIDKAIDRAELQLSKSVSNDELFTLMQLGKSLIYFTTSLKSNQAVIERLRRSRLIKKYEEDDDLLEDVLIEYNQALEMANIYASIINGTMDAYASIISNNLNVVMKFLASMTIVLTVPTMVSGFFGQNVVFPHDAGFSANFWPFVLTTGLSLIFVGLAIWYLKRKDLF